MPILLSGFYFFYFGVIGIYIIFLPKILSLLGYSSSEIGIIFSASPLVRFILPFFFTNGFELNKNRFNLAVILMLISSISFYLTLQNFYALFLSNIALGVAMSLILPYVEVIALNSIKKEKYGKVRLFGSIGFIAVALILVKFLSSAYIAIFYLIGFSFLTAIFSYFVAKKDGKVKDNKKGSKDKIDIFKDWQLWLGLILMQVSFGAFYNFFTIYETAHNISLDMTINLWVFGVIVEIIMLFFQGTLLQKFSLVTILQFTTLSAVLRWFLVFYFPTSLPILFFAQSLHALSFALFYTAAISYLHILYSNKVLAQQFFSGLTFGLGGLIGAISSGYIYDIYPDYIFLVSSVIALLATILLFLVAKN